MESKPRPRTASTSLSSLPPTPQSQVVKPQKRNPPAPVIAALHTKINGSSQSLAELKTRNRRLKAKIAEKKREVARMGELHRYCQTMIQKHEKEMGTYRAARVPELDVRQRKGELLAVKMTQFAALKDQIQSHICSTEELEVEALPDSHPNPVVHLMLSQLLLFRNQIHSQEAAFLQLLSNFSKDEEVCEVATGAIQRELVSFRSLRFAEMVQVARQNREEEFESERRSGKSLDPHSAESGLAVAMRLKEKVMSRDSKFLQAVEARIRNTPLVAEK